jgi:hypothetical protein
MSLKIKRILNGNDLPPRVCFCHSESVFFGKFCPYCECDTATYGAFFVYPWQFLKVSMLFLKTLIRKWKVQYKNRRNHESDRADGSTYGMGETIWF